MASSGRRAQKAIRARGSNKCPDHQGKEVIFVCTDCGGNLACSTCVITTHKKHTLEEIVDIIPQAKTKIQDYVSKIENGEIQRLETEMKSVSGKLADNKKHFKDVIKGVRQRNREVKENIDKITESHIKVCQKLQQENDNNLQKYRAELQSRIDTISSQIQELKEVLQTGTNIQVYDVSAEIPNQSSDVYLPLIQTVTFDPVSISLKQLEELMGELSVKVKDTRQHLKESQQESHSSNIQAQNTTQKRHYDNRHPNYTKQPELSQDVKHTWRVVSNFKNIDVELDVIFPSPDDNIFGQGYREFIKIDRKGEVIETFGKGVYCTRCSMSQSTHDIWFYNHEDDNIRKVTGQTSKHMFHCDEGVDSMCVSVDGTILLSSEGRIIRYSQNGNEIKRVENMHSENRNCFHISECQLTQNLAVCHSDRQGEGNKRHITIMDSTFNTLCRVSEHTGEVRDKPWQPRCTCFDQEGNLLVLDYEITNVIKYNSKGEFIQTIGTGLTSILRSVCVQNNGEIWVVSIHGEVRILSKQ